MILTVFWFAAGVASASTRADTVVSLTDRLNPDLLAELFPGAEHVGPVNGRPAAAPVFMEGELDGFLTTVGYVFSVGEILQPTGYTGQPFEVIVGIDLEGFISGVVLAGHNEPVFRNTESKISLKESVSALQGVDVLAVPFEVPERYARLGDASALVLLDSIYRAGREVAVSRELRGPGEREGRQLDTDQYQRMDWTELRRIGAVRRLFLTHGNLASVLGEAQINSPTTASEENEAVIDLYVALVTPALIGRNLLGNDTYVDKVEVRIGDADTVLLALGDQAMLSDYEKIINEDASVLTSRVQFRQNGLVFPLDGLEIHEIETIDAENSPVFQRVLLLQISKKLGFDATRPWTLELGIGSGDTKTVFGLTYVLPSLLVIEPLPHLVAIADNRQQHVPPFWVSVWLDQKVGIVIVAASLLVLVVMLTLQGRLARLPKTILWFRTGFLVFTLVWVGWYAGAQLSVMHLLSIIRAPFENWSLSSLLLDPITVIVMAFSVLGLVMFGRGVFCGWLCPFGALQELLNKAARCLGLRQIHVPEPFNERLWSLKYVILVVLIGISFFDAPHLASAVEIEPFNTVILYGFVRSWPYTLFAIAVLGVGLFVERFFCRYMCPLGAGFSILGHWRMLEWFRRRPECGSSCHICSDLCSVQAIGADGNINMNECYHCLSCQVAFYDEQTCPPLMARRDRRGRILETETA